MKMVIITTHNDDQTDGNYYDYVIKEVNDDG